MRGNVNRRDLFETCNKELSVQYYLPSLDSETCLSSTFDLVRRSFSAQHVVNTIISYVSEQAVLVVIEFKKGCRAALRTPIDYEACNGAAKRTAIRNVEYVRYPL